MRRKAVLIALVLLLASGAAMAQTKGAMADQRLGPENFGPLGVTYCDPVPANIPDNQPFGVISTVTVPCDGTVITDLDVPDPGCSHVGR